MLCGLCDLGAGLLCDGLALKFTDFLVELLDECLGERATLYKIVLDLFVNVELVFHCLDVLL